MYQVVILVLTLSRIASALSAGGPGGQQRQYPCNEAFAEREYFYVGGQYVNRSVDGSAGAQYMEGQIYVEQLTPPIVRHKHSLVFIHGSAQTATNWLNTPDARPGWASFFLRQGYVVYLSDQPQRGRSPWLPGSGELGVFSTSAMSSLFTAPEAVKPLPYPQAKLHTQWPGTGMPDDPVFDAFFASQVQLQTNPIIFPKQNTHAYTALLDHIGKPAILITHSQAGPFGWQIGDARPQRVAGIVAIEPGTNPFETWTGPPFAPGYLQPFPEEPFGITLLPISYSPPLPNEDPQAIERKHVEPPLPNLTPCILQREPARQLVNLIDIPVLQIVGEASFHAPFSYCVAEYLEQAGVNVDFVDLGDVGIHGNGHMMLMEKNNLEIAEKVILPWLSHVEKPLVLR